MIDRGDLIQQLNARGDLAPHENAMQDQIASMVKNDLPAQSKPVKMWRVMSGLLAAIPPTSAPVEILKTDTVPEYWVFHWASTQSSGNGDNFILFDTPGEEYNLYYVFTAYDVNGSRPLAGMYSRIVIPGKDRRLMYKGAAMTASTPYVAIACSGYPIEAVGINP